MHQILTHLLASREFDCCQLLAGGGSPAAVGTEQKLTVTLPKSPREVQEERDATVHSSKQKIKVVARAQPQEAESDEDDLVE